MNRRLTTTDPKNQTTTFTYHPGGTLASLKDARNQIHTFEYDLLNRRTKFTYPGGSFEQWTFHDTVAPGQVWTVYRGRDGSTMSCTYNHRGWETFCNDSDPNTPDVTRTYDAAGRVLTVTTSTASHTYSYDPANQLLSETTTPAGLAIPFTVAYTYDADGNRSRLTYPSGLEVNYTYTARNQLKEVVADGPPPLASYGYDLNGNRISKTLENGTTTTYSYDMASRLTQVAHSAGSINLATVGYTLNAVGNRTQKAVAGSIFNRTESYTFDLVDQLTGVNYGGGLTAGYEYDPVGNRTSVTGSVPGAGAYTANHLNQYWLPSPLPNAASGLSSEMRYLASQSSAQGKVNLHDARGNLTTVGTERAFDYDSKNRLRAAQNGTNTMAVTYDHQNRPVSRTVNGTTYYFVYDGWSLLEERDATGNLLQTYVHGAQIDEVLWKQNTAGEVYYHHDGLGSTVALTDATGAKIESYTYDVFGAVQVFDSTLQPISHSTYANRFLFTGREWIGELGIYDYRNRVYSAELERFLQTDPIQFEAGDVNLYRYVANRPADLRDTRGTRIETPWDCAGRIADEVGQQSPRGSGDPSSRWNHCVASCRISRECPGGSFIAWLAGDWVQDPWWQEEGETGSDPLDRRANKVGRDASKCRDKNCEELCHEAFDAGSFYS